MNTFGIAFCSLLLANYLKHKTMHKMRHFKLKMSFSVSAFGKEGQMISKVIFYRITSLKKLTYKYNQDQFCIHFGRSAQ